LPALDRYAGGAFDGIRWRPSIHMPRWASRITLEIVAVHTTRLQSITEGGAIAEGIDPISVDGEQAIAGDHYARQFGSHPYVGAFACLWDSLYEKREGCSWADDPVVWVLAFERVEERRGG
jgi:hypothetical protein